MGWSLSLRRLWWYEVCCWNFITYCHIKDRLVSKGCVGKDNFSTARQQLSLTRDCPKSEGTNGKYNISLTIVGAIFRNRAKSYTANCFRIVIIGCLCSQRRSNLADILFSKVMDKPWSIVGSSAILSAKINDRKLYLSNLLSTGGNEGNRKLYAFHLTFNFVN